MITPTPKRMGIPQTLSITDYFGNIWGLHQVSLFFESDKHGNGDWTA